MATDDENLSLKYLIDSYKDKDERIIKRLWILCLVIFTAFVLSNLAWIIRENQFETVETITTQEIVQDSVTGDNFAIGGDFNVETNYPDHHSD